MNIFELNPQLQAALSGAPTLWLGDQASFDAVAHAQHQVSLLTPEKKAAMLVGGSMARDSNGFPAIWEKRGNSAIINVSGGLIDGNAGYGRFFGVIGYDDIAEAAISAYSDPDVKAVMWKIESPGGQVSGVMDCGAILTKLSSMKKSMVYTSNLMASGGYWLGTSIRGEIAAGPTAEVGSIGVVMILTDVTKALDEMGIKKTVMRSGEDKARVNPFEELTKEARAHLQQSMDDVHNIFRAHVSAGRPDLSTEELLAATTGRTFLGKRAKAAGLVDKVASFEQALKLLDSQIPAGNTPSNSKGATMKTVLTDAQIAQIQAGVPLEQLGLSAEAVVEVRAEMEAQAKAAQLASDKVAEDAAKAAAEATNAAAAAEAAKKAAGGTETADALKLAADLSAANIKIDLLQSQLVTAHAEVGVKAAALVALEASTQTMRTNHDGLTAALKVALAQKQVAMGGSDTTEGMDAAAVTVEFTRLNEAFLSKFKIGQASKGAEADKPGAQVDAGTLAFQRAAIAAQAARTAKAK